METNKRMIAIAPDGKAAYVTIQTGTATPGGGAYEFMPVDLATDTPGKPVKISGEPVAIAISPDGKTAYIAIFSSGTVTPIDLTTDTPAKPIKVSGEPVAIAITPDGTTAYVANQVSSTVTPIDLATNTPGKPIRVGHGWATGFEAIAIVP